ncbi:serine hydrolase domain-containing protein [Streptomyces sp. DASNCL29]|uniref:serine hydrolase domain-containing protein n=1 Tax=Streptomyces sp. DASNCL29 TaxID=2583819 RepID=UPI0019D26661|nr:serine hydrolase domain-containing protein [Streptomyces sp. DASNCL29]
MTERAPMSRRRLRAALTLTLATCLTAAAAAGGASAASAVPLRTEAVRADTWSADAGHVGAVAGRADRLATLVRQAVDAGVPGVAVRIDNGHGPAVESTEQAPWTVADHKLAVDDEFRMGSNTKTLVATLILQLVAEHQVNLTDSVESWLPGLVPGGGAITLRMLLNHTSGLYDYTDDPAGLASVTGQDQRQWTPEELLALATRHQALFTPSKKWFYSNTNYIALGMVLEKATGRSVADLIDERIVRPLGLTHTYLATTAAWRPGDSRTHTHSYEPDAAHLGPLLPPGMPPGTSFAGPIHDDHVNTTGINPSWAWAAGAVVSSAADWARFDTALMSGELLPPAQLRQMRTTVPEDSAAPEATRYGLGLEEVRTPCGTVWGHTGGIPGYASQNYTDSTGHRTVAILTSTVFGLSERKVAATYRPLVDAAVCRMLGKTAPGTAAQSTALPG